MREATAADEIGEEAQPVKPPPPGRVVWAKLARFPWWPAEVYTSFAPTSGLLLNWDTCPVVHIGLMQRMHSCAYFAVCAANSQLG